MATRPTKPSDLSVGTWWRLLRESGTSFVRDSLGDRAATLTYFSVLSIFPGVIVLVSLLGVVGGGQGTIDDSLAVVDQLGGGSATEALRGPIASAVSSKAAGIALVVGLALALWSASGYVGALIRASNSIYEVEETRPVWKLRPLQLAITIALVVIMAAAMLVLALTGPLADAIGEQVGVGDAVLTVWSIAKWPLVFALVATLVGLLYRFCPDAPHTGLRWILPASFLATVAWLAASAGFAFYLANFGSYANTYGGLAGAVVFLLWLWLGNSALLLGARLAAALEREASLGPPTGDETTEAASAPAWGTEDESAPAYSAVGAGRAAGSDSPTAVTDTDGSTGAAETEVSPAPERR